MIEKFTIREGTVEWVLIGEEDLPTSKVRKKLKVFPNHGIMSDPHAGSRILDAREDDLLKRGFIKNTPMANTREWSAVSVEELNEISRRMDTKTLPLGVLGENIVVHGIPNFSTLPPSTTLLFKSADGEQRSTVLAVWGPNMPCETAGKSIETWAGRPNIGQRFYKAALHRRGLVGFVLIGGAIKPGDTIIARIPDVRPYVP